MRNHRHKNRLHIIGCNEASSLNQCIGLGCRLERQYAKVDIMRLVNGRVVEFREFYDTASMVCDLERASAAR